MTGFWVWPGSGLLPVNQRFCRRTLSECVCVLMCLCVCVSSGSSGGICEKSKLYSDGKKKSLNTGIITVQNYASHVPPKVSHITFAHEVGHNFGSPVSGCAHVTDTRLTGYMWLVI